MRYGCEAAGVALRLRRWLETATARQATVSSTAMRLLRRATVCSLAGVACLTPAPAGAADLQPRTAQAFEEYAKGAARDFVARAQKAAAAARRCDGVIGARAGSEDGILSVPGGLIHHWVGFAFIRGARLREVDAVARDYSSYSKTYTNVVSAKVLSQKGDSYRVLIRLKEGEAGINAVLDVRSAVDYRTLGAGGIMAISRSEEIREVENAGRANESLLPAGRDSGYLWRAQTFTYFISEEDGVLVVMETLGLSRQFPRGFGWIIEPIARRLGRKSVEGSLSEFASAIRRSANLQPTGPTCN